MPLSANVSRPWAGGDESPFQSGSATGSSACAGWPHFSPILILRPPTSSKPHKYRTTRKRYDKVRYQNRNQVERFFNRIKQFRRVATRYEKTVENFAGFVWLAALMVNVL
jgi:Transposase DDE domain